MRIKVGLITQKLANLLSGQDYDRFTEDKELTYYRFTIQNLGKSSIWIENGEEAVVGDCYKLFPGNSLEIKTNNLHKIYFIAEKIVNEKVIIITT